MVRWQLQDDCTAPGAVPPRARKRSSADQLQPPQFCSVAVAARPEVTRSGTAPAWCERLQGPWMLMLPHLPRQHGAGPFRANAHWRLHVCTSDHVWGPWPLRSSSPLRLDCSSTCPKALVLMSDISSYILLVAGKVRMPDPYH